MAMIKHLVIPLLVAYVSTLSYDCNSKPAIEKISYKLLIGSQFKICKKNAKRSVLEKNIYSMK